MATIRLVPSTYYLSSSSYLSVSDASNMYTNTDSDTYATVYNSRTQTTSYYIYLRGFNFNSLPSGAVVNSFTIKLKARESGVSTSTSYQPYLADGTSTINGSCSPITTTTSTHTFSGISANWDTIVGYGSDFGIRINCRRNSRNTAAYVYIYGAEIEVDYTIPVQYTVTATSTVNSVAPSPATQEITEGDNAVVRFDAENLNGVIVTDNDVDVTNQLEQHLVQTGGTLEKYPESHTTSGISSGSQYAAYCIGYSAEDPYSSTSNMYASSGSTGYAEYSFDFSDIPSNATITSVSVTVAGHRESSTTDSTHVSNVQLYSGSTAKGDDYEFTSTSNQTHTMTNIGTWTRAELQNAKLRHTVGYYGGLVTGVTWTVEYETPNTGNQYYWTYTINNVTATHTVLVTEAGPFIPPEEDPTYEYFPITISSVNAQTSPGTGTIRVQEDTNQTITITPLDPQLTLALDNGVDITSRLVGGVPSNVYTIDTQVSGASYGFSLNSSTGYYISTNNGVNKSASVARLNMDFESDCLVTIEYINYAEADYDYGMFGKLDTTVATDGLTASSGGSSPSDSTSNYQLARCTNSANPQTITYQVPMGQHYIDIKYGKDDASDSNNDSLQWKVTEVQATSAGGDYTYTLTNVNKKHSLVFIFGNVNYYFITSSGNASKLFPDGQMVVLENDSYQLTIVPNDPDAEVSITDNGINRTPYLTYEEGQDKNGNKVANYTYSLSDINAAHTLVVTCVSSEGAKIFIKQSGTWTPYSKVYLKVNGTWVEQSSSKWATLFDTSLNYRLL